MPNQEHLRILKKGVEVWNKWRYENDSIKPNLSEAKLQMVDLQGVDLRGADLRKVELFGANLYEADLRGADLRGADLSGTNLYVANFSEANLSEANLIFASANNSDFTRANLTKANLNRVAFVEANLEGANLSNSSIYGISAWNLRTNSDTQQLNLVITKKNEPIVTVDDIEVAQFIYLLIRHEKLRNVINSVTKKGVLILGRFGGGGI